MFGKIRLNRNQSIAISIMTILLMVYMHVSWTKNRLKDVVELKTKVTTAKAELEKNRTLEANLKGKAPSYLEIQTSNDLLERYLKSNERFSSIVDGIVSSSNGRDFLLSKMLADSQVEMNGYIQTLYKIEAEATFLSIGKFLESLEDSPLLSEVQTIEIKRNQSELRICNVKIDLLSYSSGSPQLPLKVTQKKKEEESAPSLAPPALNNGLFSGLIQDALAGRVPAAAVPPALDKKAVETQAQEQADKKKKKIMVKPMQEISIPGVQIK